MFQKIRLALVIALVTSALLTSSVSAVNYGHQLYSGNDPGYSRAIKLSNGKILASFSIDYAQNNSAIPIYVSTDNGETFALVTNYVDAAESGYATGCPDILEVSPGVLVMAYNVWDESSNNSTGEKLKIARSTDWGATWVVISQPEPNFTVWNWEPELIISSDGRLQLYYAWSRTVKANNMSMFDQVIVRRESTDGGVTWTSRTTAAGSTSHNLGMPVITKLGSTYYMLAEDYDDNAADYLRSSTDGKTWTGNKALGTSSGWMMSTPAIASVNGALYALGKTYYVKSGCFFPLYCSKHANNGKVILKSTNGGTSWTEVTAPFTFIANDDYANWSPGLLPLSNTTMFMITSSDNTTPRSERYDTGPLP